MKLYRFVLLFIVGLLPAVSVIADDTDSLKARQYIRKGNKAFRADKRKDAQVAFVKAIVADKTNSRAKYNLATAMFARDFKATPKELTDSMANYFKEAAENESNPLRKSMAYHNMGVMYQCHQDFGKAIDAYKNALRNNPNDDETRYNLVLCQKQLKNQSQQNQNQDQDQNQDQQDQQQQQQQQQQEKDQQKDQQKEPPMSKDNAEQLLNAAMQQEKKTQERMKEAQQQPQRRRIEKNW